MLARTVLQPALPTTFGYQVAGWFAGVDRSWRMLSEAFDASLQLQLGGAAGTMAVYGRAGPELAATLAGGWSFPFRSHHGIRGASRLASLVAHCGVYAGSLAKIARDIALLMQPEIGEVQERGGGSSAMPHKRNPAGSVVALAASFAAMAQEHERGAGGWQAEWPIRSGRRSGCRERSGSGRGNRRG